MGEHSSGTETALLVSSIYEDSSVGERLRSDSFPDGADYQSFAGRALSIDRNGGRKLLSFDEFLCLYEKCVFVKVNRVPAVQEDDLYRIACLMPDGTCLEAPLFSVREALDLLAKESMRLKPAMWLGHSVLLTKGSLSLPGREQDGPGFEAGIAY